jgi:hypothetical protein
LLPKKMPRSLRATGQRFTQRWGQQRKTTAEIAASGGLLQRHLTKGFGNQFNGTAPTESVGLGQFDIKRLQGIGRLAAVTKHPGTSLARDALRVMPLQSVDMRRCWLGRKKLTDHRRNSTVTRQKPNGRKKGGRHLERSGIMTHNSTMTFSG